MIIQIAKLIASVILGSLIGLIIAMALVGCTPEPEPAKLDIGTCRWLWSQVLSTRPDLDEEAFEKELKYIYDRCGDPKKL